jgi:hypothetical protein
MSDSLNALIATPQGGGKPIDWSQVYQGLQRYKDISAQQATAGIYQQSIDPTTGAFNQGKFNALVGQSPAAAWNAGPTMQQAGNAQVAQSTAQNLATSGQIARRTYAQGAMTDLLQNPNTTMSDIINRIHQEAQGGILLPEEANAFAQQAQTFQGTPHDFLVNTSQANLDALNQLRNSVGGIERFETPNGTQFARTAPGVQTGAPGQPAGPNVPNMGMVTPLDIRMSDGTIRQVLPAGVPAFLGQNPGASVVGPSASGPVPAGGGGPGFGSGRYPAPAVPPVSPASPAAALAVPSTTTTAPPGPTAGVSPAPGLVPNIVAAGASATGRSNALIDQQQATTTIKPILAGMDQDIDVAGGTGTGSKVLGAMRQALIRFGLAPESVNLSTGQAAQEQFNKFSSQLQAAQLGTIGGVPTDDRQALAQAANPSLVLTSAGNKGIIHVLQGNQDASDAMGRAWLASPQYRQNPGGFDQWRAQFTAKDPTSGGQFDPRVFWLANMTRPEQTQYVQTMQKNNPAEFAQFNKNWRFAKAQGWTQPIPAQPQPSQSGG